MYPIVINSYFFQKKKEENKTCLNLTEDSGPPSPVIYIPARLF